MLSSTTHLRVQLVGMHQAPACLHAAHIPRVHAASFTNYREEQTWPLTAVVGMMQVKPDDAWSFDVHSALVWEDRVQGDYRDALACGAKLLHVFNMFRLRAPRDHDASNDTVTYLWPLENLAGA